MKYDKSTPLCFPTPFLSGHPFVVAAVARGRGSHLRVSTVLINEHDCDDKLFKIPPYQIVPRSSQTRGLNAASLCMLNVSPAWLSGSATYVTALKHPHFSNPHPTFILAGWYAYSYIEDGYEI